MSALVGHTTIGERNRFFPGAVIGGEPQDIGYTGSATRVEIGDDNLFREGVTVNRGADKEDGITRIGHRNFLMANTHVAHNCHVFNNVILCNGSLLGGHVHVQDYAIVSGKFRRPSLRDTRYRVFHRRWLPSTTRRAPVHACGRK